MAVVGKFRAGKNSRVKVASTNLNRTDWSVTHRIDDLDTTHFEAGGYDQGTVGVQGCDWDCRGDWDAGQNAYDSPPGLYPRDDLANLYFYENTTDNIFWLFAVARVLSARNGAQIRQKVTFESSGKSNGSFTVPTGSV